MEPLNCHHLERCPDCMAKYTQLREAVEVQKAEWRMQAETAVRRLGRIKQLEAAVEWACSEMEREANADVLLSLDEECRKLQEGIGNIIRLRLASFATELRRRAKEG